MRANWEDAPQWAQYLTWYRDYGIEFYEWHEKTPTRKDGFWTSEGKKLRAVESESTFGMEERP